MKNLVIACVALMANASFACGPKWSEPRSHFPFLDEQGRLSIWESVSSINLGNQSVPIRLNFDPARPGGILGKGWSIPILESRIYQVDDRIFRQDAPDGWTRNFARDSKNPNIIKSASGWIGSLDGDEIVIYSECGWKMFYKKGHLSGFTEPSGINYTVIRTGGYPVGLSSNGQTLFELVPIKGTENLRLTIKSSKDYELQMRTRPMVQNVGEVNVVGQTVRSLGAIADSGGAVTEFSYSVTPKLVPEIAISRRGRDEELLLWDSMNFEVIRHNDYLYQTSRENSVITIRRSAIDSETPSDADSETWKNDASKGVSSIRAGRRYYQETRKFNSGANAGAIREKTEIVDGRTKKTRFIYSETGEIIRRSIKEFDKDSPVKEYYETPEVSVLALSKKTVESQKTLEEVLGRFGGSSKYNGASGVFSARLNDQEILYQFNETTGTFRPL